MRNVLIFCAHADDSEISLGGTMLKYSPDFNIVKVIFSSGEKSSPHLKESHIIGERITESDRISKKMGVKETLYFHLMDRKLQEFSEDEGVVNQTKNIIKTKSTRVPTAEITLFVSIQL